MGNQWKLMFMLLVSNARNVVRKFFINKDLILKKPLKLDERMGNIENPTLAKFTFNLGKNTSIILKSLSPEAKREIPRTKTNIKEVNGILVMEIEATDTNSLRAAINSYLRWIKCSLDVCNLIN